MTTIRITGYCGIVIRRAALVERQIPIESVLHAMEATAPLDMDENLISFGPSFGEEALNTFTERLTGLGLVFYDDFFDTVWDSPPWCNFKAELAE